jgi:hypothetical protein
MKPLNDQHAGAADGSLNLVSSPALLCTESPPESIAMIPLSCLLPFFGKPVIVLAYICTSVQL